MTGISRFIVVVPARNEETLVKRCLTSIAEANRFARVSLGERCPELAVVLVADSCTDRTAQLARGIPGVTVLEIDAANVGSARAAGVGFALGANSAGQSGGGAPGMDHTWIANTDADSIVPPQWITSQVALADSGIDLVLGTVRPEFADLSAAQIRIWKATHIPGHPSGNVHGANLGVRASDYLAAGGFFDHAEHEDVDLVRRLRDNDARWVTTDDGEVITSGRRVGRTPGGYAAFLALQAQTAEHDAAQIPAGPPTGELSTVAPL